MQLQEYAQPSLNNDTFRGCPVVASNKLQYMQLLPRHRLVDQLPRNRVASEQWIVDSWTAYWTSIGEPWVVCKRPARGYVRVWKERG